MISDEKHNIGVTGLTTTSADIEVFSTIQKATFNIGDEKMFDVNDDDVYDLKITLNSISSNKADLTVEYIQEAITPETADQGVTQVDGTVDESGDAGTDVVGDDGEGDLTWLWITIAILLAIGIVGYFLKKKGDNVAGNVVKRITSKP